MISVFSLFMEALNSILGLLLIYYSISLYKLYKGGHLEHGFKYLSLVALLITLKEAGYFISYSTGLYIVNELLTTLIIISLTYSMIQFRIGVANMLSGVSDKRILKELLVE